MGAIGALVLVGVIIGALLGPVMREAGPGVVSDAAWVPGFSDGLPWRPPASERPRNLTEWRLSAPDRVQIHHDFVRRPGSSGSLTLLLPSVTGEAAAFVNGLPTAPDTPEAPRHLASGNRAISWTFPRHLLQPGLNRIDVVVTASRHRALEAPPLLGQEAAVRPLQERLSGVARRLRQLLPGLALLAATLGLGAAAAARSSLPWVALSGAAASVGARAFATTDVLAVPLVPFGAALDQMGLSAALICLGCGFLDASDPPLRRRPWIAGGAALFLLLLALAVMGAYRGQAGLQAAGLGLPILGLIFLAASAGAALRHPSGKAPLAQVVEGAVVGLLALTVIVAVLATTGVLWGLWVAGLEPAYGLGLLTLLFGMAGTAALRTIQGLARWIQDRPRLARIIQTQKQEIAAAALALRQQERRSAVLEERQRLSRDMHDGIGGQLTSLLARVRSRRISADQLEGELASGLAELRLMVDSLDASDGPVADALGVLRSRVRTQGEAAGMSLEWFQSDLLSDVVADPRWILNLNRLIQEAVTNAVRHSGGETLGVEVRVMQDGRLAITVRDDGSGFDRGQIEAGRGLSNMTFRAAQMGGSIRFSRGETGRGTVVEAVIAVPGPPTAGQGHSTDEMMPS
ncbi:sensor histidine kinase [Brevundimonas sp.]|uniref:sensor histidine kinase n=1 Tax=Brevundimonas sp. TaxID=1871086 RepID=UPI002ABA685E|nr:ATP-binding protein [Brevundimonas sp.]MDZ4364149.1 ATP-binding protein [Brevundimonas sp.]